MSSRVLFQMPNRNAAVNGCMDARLGISDKISHCQTCKKRLTDCAGHFGYIQLELPVFHAGYFKHTLTILQCICKKCSRVLVPTQYRAGMLKKMANTKIDALMRGALFKRVIELWVIYCLFSFLFLLLSVIFVITVCCYYSSVYLFLNKLPFKRVIELWAIHGFIFFLISFLFYYFYFRLIYDVKEWLNVTRKHPSIFCHLLSSLLFLFYSYCFTSGYYINFLLRCSICACMSVFFLCLHVSDCRKDKGWMLCYRCCSICILSLLVISYAPCYNDPLSCHHDIIVK